MYIMISVHFYINIKTETLDKDIISLSLSHIMRAHDNCMTLSSYFRCNMMYGKLHQLCGRYVHMYACDIKINLNIFISSQ